MSCIQATGVGKPSFYLPDRAQLKRIHCTTRHSLYLPDRVQLKRVDCTTRRTSLKLNATTQKHFAPRVKCGQKSAAVCLLGGKDKSGDEGAPWKDFSKAMGNLGKGQSIEDVLRQQIEKQEFYDGDGGKGPPRRGGSGGGGGGGSGESEDEGYAGIIDETVQVTLATLGFILLYIYIIAGEEIALLVKDYLKYLSKGIKSNRLQSTMDAWERIWKPREKEIDDKYWLEKEIIRTPTWFDHPDKYREVLRSYMESQNDDDDDDDNDE